MRDVDVLCRCIGAFILAADPESWTGV